MKVRNKITNTYPSIFHLSGCKKWNRLGHTMWEKLYSENKTENDQMEKLRSDTCLIFPHYGYTDAPMVEKSLLKFGVSNTNIAELYMKGGTDLMSFFSNRHKMTKDYIEKNNFKYIIGQDAGDIFFLNHPNRVVEIFENEFDCDMLLNGECEVWPDQAKFVYDNLEGTDKYDSSKIFKNLNAGLYITKADFYLEFYETLLKTPMLQDGTDQGQVHQVYLKHSPRIQVDSECKIFQNTSFRKRFRGKDNDILEIE
jgi:hypothetical protein